VVKLAVVSSHLYTIKLRFPIRRVHVIHPIGFKFVNKTILMCVGRTTGLLVFKLITFIFSESYTFSLKRDIKI